MTPESFDRILISVFELVSRRSVRFRGVHRAWLLADVIPHEQKTIPVLLTAFMVVLRNIHEIIELWMIKRLAMACSPQIPVIPHFRDHHASASGFRAAADQLRPICAPLGLRLRFVVHAIQHMVELERLVQQLIDERLLIFQHRRVVTLSRRRKKEWLFISTRMIWIPTSKPGFFERVIYVLGRTVRVFSPTLWIVRSHVGVIESIPNLDLNEDAAFLRLNEKPIKPPPVFWIPLLQIVLAAGQLLPSTRWQ